MPTAQQILDTEWNPTFAFRPGQDAPLPPEANFQRGSAAYTLDPNGKIIKAPSGSPRNFLAGQPLRLERQQTQHISSPNALPSGRNATTSKIGTLGVADVWEIIEDSSSDVHDVLTSIYGSSQTGKTVNLSAMVRPAGRNWLVFRVGINGPSGAYKSFYFNIENGETTSASFGSQASAENHKAIYLQNGWYLCTLTVKPDTDHYVGNFYLRLAKSSGNDSYAGNGSDGVEFVYWQGEDNVYATTPILDESGDFPTRNTDNLDFDIGDYTGGDELTIFIDYTTLQKERNNVAADIVTDADSNARLSYENNNEAGIGIRYYDSTDTPTSKIHNASPYGRNRVAASISDFEGIVNLGVNGETLQSNIDGGVVGSTNMILNAEDRILMDVHEFAIEPTLKTQTELEALTKKV